MTKQIKKYSIIPYVLDIQQGESDMSLSSHLEELRQRFVWSLLVILSFIILCVCNVKYLVKVLQEPAIGIKFLQFAPGEYFFVSIKISICVGVLLGIPFLIYQIILFILPGMTQNERKIILPLFLGVLSLFVCGIMFGYYVLIPAALNFFINYGSEVVEPFWSFEQYFEFVLTLLFSTGFAFQLPVVQIILGMLRIVSWKSMLSIWRYVVLFSTILGAILTPSIDPLTQIFMSFIIIALYFFGASIVLLIEKSRSNIVYNSKF